jgi:hypothetical protein
VEPLPLKVRRRAGPQRATDIGLPSQVDVAEADWRKCGPSGGGADRSALAITGTGGIQKRSPGIQYPRFPVLTAGRDAASEPPNWQAPTGENTP